MKEKVRPIYNELQGYLSQAPSPSDQYTTTYDRVLWTQFNDTVTELRSITGKNYDRYLIRPEPGGDRAYIHYSTYRSSLGGLIARLNGEYFSDEEPPFKGMPNTVINQTQTQSQSISTILEIQEKILSEIPKYAEGTKERTFLEKVKSSLPSLKTGMDIIYSLLKIGADAGLTPEVIHKLIR